MSVPRGFGRVLRRTPCTICGKGDWCLRALDGSGRALCARVPSDVRWGDCGWLHGDASPARQASTSRWLDPLPDYASWERRARACRERLLERSEIRLEVAVDLLLPVETFDALGVGILYERGPTWTTWPMRDGAGRVTGLRLRGPGARKLSVRGSRSGLFVPDWEPTDLCLITEGPTDCAAALALGFFAVGRSSCQGGAQLLVEFLRRHRQVAQVVVLADNDVPGVQGARDLAERVAPYASDVRVALPPGGAKDLRAARCAGATPDDLHRSIEAAVPTTCAVRRRS